MAVEWEFEYAVETAARRDDAWRFWTNVENWAIDPAVEWVRLEGPFEAGAVGETKQRGMEPVRWRIAEARECERAVFEFEMPGAAVRFAMSFEAVAAGVTRLRQRITLEGPGAKDLAAGLGPDFAQGVRAGMDKLAEAIERAATGEDGDARASR
jgi:hypothetical protein